MTRAEKKDLKENEFPDLEYLDHIFDGNPHNETRMVKNDNKKTKEKKQV